MMEWLKRILIGKPLENEALKHEKYTIFWGLPILASDAISSVAYAIEEILLVLIPVVGFLSFTPLICIISSKLPRCSSWHWLRTPLMQVFRCCFP